MPRKHKYATERSFWTKPQLDLMEILIKDSEQYHDSVPWREYLAELGHPLSTVRTMASHIRARRLTEKNRAYNRAIRAQADAAVGYEPARQRDLGTPENPLLTEQPAPPDRFNRNGGCTSTARLIHEVEMRAKIALQGITAAQFGDPPPGRSVLDRRRAGVVEPEPRRQGSPWHSRPVTLATRPWKSSSNTASRKNNEERRTEAAFE